MDGGQDNTPQFTHPVPRACPIPKNAVAFIGGLHGPHPRYLLWKDGQEITVEVPHADFLSEYDPDDEFFDWKVIQKSKQVFGHYLQIIQSQLDQIQFGATNWAYLLPNKRAPGFYIRQRERILRTVSCPLWAPVIMEDEIMFTVWGQAWDRRGIWDGREVDILYAWDETNIIQLDCAMYAYRILQGMDLTFELYGHLLRKDGTVIGLVSQAAKGRMLKLSDRSLVYQNISILQARGCLYRGCGTNRFLVSPEGKLRLLEIFSLVVYSMKQRDSLEKDAELWHWKELEDLFNEIKTYGPFGNYRYPPDRLTATATDLQLLTPSAGPERPLGGIFLYHSPNFFITYMIPVWDGFLLIEQTATDHLNSFQTRPGNSGVASICNSSDAVSAIEREDKALTFNGASPFRVRTVLCIRSRNTAYPHRLSRVPTLPTATSDRTDNSDLN